MKIQNEEIIMNDRVFSKGHMYYKNKKYSHQPALFGRSGYKTSESFPAVWYYDTEKVSFFDNFRWLGRLVIKNPNGDGNLSLYAKGKEKEETMESLSFGLAAFTFTKEFETYEDYNDPPNKENYFDVTNLIGNFTLLGSRFEVSLKNQSKKFDVIPNVKCQICDKSLNAIVDELFPEYANNFDDFFCRNCWKEICQESVTKSNPEVQFEKQIKSEMRRAVAYKNGERGIHWTTLGERDNWICHLCQCQVEKIAGTAKFLMGASVDHVIPIAKNGLHSWQNVKLAHLLCNMQKGAKVLTPS
jgi:5-methylcytosine-specific restriction endonuclease McrA